MYMCPVSMYIYHGNDTALMNILLCTELLLLFYVYDLY